MSHSLETITNIDRHNRAANIYPKKFIDLMPHVAKWIEQRRYNTEVYLNNPDESTKNNALYLIHTCNEEIKNILAIIEIPKS